MAGRARFREGPAGPLLAAVALSVRRCLFRPSGLSLLLSGDSSVRVGSSASAAGLFTPDCTDCRLLAIAAGPLGPISAGSLADTRRTCNRLVRVGGAVGALSSASASPSRCSRVVVSPRPRTLRCPDELRIFASENRPTD